MIYHLGIIDEESKALSAWTSALSPQVTIQHYSAPQEFISYAQLNPQQRFYCVITARYFLRLGLDLLHDPLAAAIKKSAACPLFLNWPGSATIVNKHGVFDGTISLHFGISLPGLQMKIKRLHRKKISPASLAKFPSKQLRCQQLLHHMAQQAQGSHRKTLITIAANPSERGIKLLESIYQRLLASQEVPSTCPSRYINSSPMIALRILKEIFATGMN